MDVTSLLTLRTEILLTILILYHLVADLSANENKVKVINASLLLFGIITTTGFIFPSEPTRLFGNMFVHDEVRTLLKNILNISTLVVLLQSTGWLQKEAHHAKVGPFLILLFSALLGMDFMISAGDFLMLYLGLELATLPLAILAAFDKDQRRSAEAGIKLLMSSAVSSAVLLFGLSLIYGASGTLGFPHLAETANASAMMVMGLTFFLAGLGFKLSLVPFHFWTADVYEGSPLPVTTFFSVVSKGAALFALMLVLYHTFGNLSRFWTLAAYVLSISTMVIGNLFALRQRNLKRFFAFSSITQAGFMMLGFVNSDVLGMKTIVYFMLIYSLSNLAVFGILSIVINATGKESIDDLNGFYKTNPGLSLIMLLALFSLAGIPPVAGFFGKFFLFTAAAARGMFILVFIAVLNATVSLYYYLLVVKAMFITPSESPIQRLPISFTERLALSICLAGIALIGFVSGIYEHISALIG